MSALSPCLCFKIIILLAQGPCWSSSAVVVKRNGTNTATVANSTIAAVTTTKAPSTSSTSLQFQRHGAGGGSSQDAIGFRKLQFSRDSPQVVQFSKVVATSFVDFTACTWLKIENSTSNFTLVSYSADSKDSNGVLRWWVSDGGSSFHLWLKSSQVVKADVKLDIGQWCYICQDWRGSNGTWALHINGQKALNGYVETKGKNWTLPGTGHWRISSENGGEIYGLTLQQLDKGPEIKGKNKTRRSLSNSIEPTTVSIGKGGLPEQEIEDIEGEGAAERPEVFNAKCEALFWNRGSTRQVETKGSSIGRVAAFLTRVIAFAIIPTMAIVNEIRKSRAKSSEAKTSDPNDDFPSFKPNQDPITTKAPEKSTPFNLDSFDNGDTFFADDDDFFKSAENKRVETKTPTPAAATRSSRSYNSQCRSSQLIFPNGTTSALKLPSQEDLLLLGAHCCWPDPPSPRVIVSWFHTGIEPAKNVKMIDVAKSTCGNF